MEEMGEHCGIVGVWGHPEASLMTYLALINLQHRGQEAAGIVASDGISLRQVKGEGMVFEVFKECNLQTLAGCSQAVGHVRYATIKNDSVTERALNIQPIVYPPYPSDDQLALAHNGTIVFADRIREDLEAQGARFITLSDSETLLQMVVVAPQEKSLFERSLRIFDVISGAYSFVLMSKDEVIVGRDRWGIQPFCYGVFKNGGFIFVSESCALAQVEAEYVRDVMPGELISISKDGVKSFLASNIPIERPCIFQMVYLTRPDSGSVASFRVALGRACARESPVEADVVVPVPDSGVFFSHGLAEALGIPLAPYILRKHNRRTFIEPEQEMRDFGTKLKLAPVSELIQGKRIILGDDSIVRGTTFQKVANMIRDAGAQEIHLRLSYPPIKYPCPYGIDIKSRDELIANHLTVSEMKEYAGLDSLAFISKSVFDKVARDFYPTYCDACLTGAYPIPWYDKEGTLLL